MDGGADGVHELLLAASRLERERERTEGPLPQLVVGNTPGGPALRRLEQGKEAGLDARQVVCALDLAHLAGGHAGVGEPDHDLPAKGGGKCGCPLRAAQIEVGIAECLRLVDGCRFDDFGHIAHDALDLVDDERVGAVVDDAVGPTLDAQEEASLVAHVLLVDVEACGVRAKGAIREEEGRRKRDLGLVGLATRRLQHAVDAASGLHGLYSAVSVALRVNVAFAQEELDEPAHRDPQRSHVAPSRVSTDAEAMVPQWHVPASSRQPHSAFGFSCSQRQHGALG